MLGGILIVAGILGILSGGSFIFEGMRIYNSLGFSYSWELLSSVAGVYLGILLVIAGILWIKKHKYARPITWAYVLGGIMINAADLYAFLFKAIHGFHRGLMILLDSMALAFPIIILIVLKSSNFRGKNGKKER